MKNEMGEDMKKTIETETCNNLLRCPLIIAHRGDSAHAPENTLAAFQKAVDLNCDLIELDVRETADGHIVVIHDHQVGRTATGEISGNISDLTLEQIHPILF